MATEVEPWSSAAALAAHELTAHGGRGCGEVGGDGAAAAAAAVLVVVDDNMHLRSMRQACYRVAAEEAAAAFVTVHVTAPLQALLQRNAQRPGVECVPEPSLRKIVAELEPPAVCGAVGGKAAEPAVYWEREALQIAWRGVDGGAPGEGMVPWLSTLSAVHPAPLPTDPAALAESVWPWLLRAWAARPAPAEVERARAAAAEAAQAMRQGSRAETAASLGVAIDGLLRKLVGGTMAAAKAKGADGNLKAVAGAANKQRKDILQRSKQRLGEEKGLAREEVLAWCEAEFADGMASALS
jgi:hypothetical protein